MSTESRRQFIKKGLYATPLLLTVAVRPSFAGSTYGGGGGDCRPKCEPRCGTQTYQSFFRWRR